MAVKYIFDIHTYIMNIELIKLMLYQCYLNLLLGTAGMFVCRLQWSCYQGLVMTDCTLLQNNRTISFFSLLTDQLVLLYFIFDFSLPFKLNIY